MNFFEQQRTKLDLTRTQMAALFVITEATIRAWEADKVTPRQSIASLAMAYEVDEQRMGLEVLAQRVRVETARVNRNIVASAPCDAYTPHQEGV